jgi:uncharacterized protein (TIGR03000 family)
MQRRFAQTLSRMPLKNLLWCGALVVSGAFATGAAVAQKKEAAPAGSEGVVTLKVIVELGYRDDEGVPKEPILIINGKKTNEDGVHTGKTERKFTSSPLKAGKDYYYSFKYTWEPNNYTTKTRVREIKVEPGKTYEVDLTKREKDDPEDDIVVRYVGTPIPTVDKLLDLAKVGKDDVVFDLGCGDGRMVCRAIAKRGAKRGVGVDIDPERIKDCKRVAKETGVEDKVEWREGDVLKHIADLKDATVVMLYMGDDIGARLSPILQKELKPGTRVVSHRFTLGDWKPDRTIRVEDKDMVNSEDMVDLHLWIVKEKDGKDKSKDEAAKPSKEKAAKEEPTKEKDDADKDNE